MERERERKWDAGTAAWLFFLFFVFMQKQSRLNLVALPVRRCTNDQGGSAVVRLKHRSVERLLLLPVPTRGALSRKCLNVGRQNDANDCKSRRALSRLSLCECEAALWGYIWFKLFSENVRAHIRCVCHMYWHTLLHIHRHTPCHKQRVLWEEVWERESTSSRQQQQQRCREWQLLTETDMRDHLCTITINTVWLTWLLTDRPAHTSEGHIWGRAKMLPGVFCTVLDTCCNSIGCREVCAVWETICFSVHVKLLFFYGSWHVSTADHIQMIIF